MLMSKGETPQRLTSEQILGLYPHIQISWDSLILTYDQKSDLDRVEHFAQIFPTGINKADPFWTGATSPFPAVLIEAQHYDQQLPPDQPLPPLVRYGLWIPPEDQNIVRVNSQGDTDRVSLERVVKMAANIATIVQNARMVPAPEGSEDSNLIKITTNKRHERRYTKYLETLGITLGQREEPYLKYLITMLARATI